MARKVVLFLLFSKLTLWDFHKWSLLKCWVLPASPTCEQEISVSWISLYFPPWQDVFFFFLSMIFLWPLTSHVLFRLFQPVQYGQKPEGRTVVFPSTQVQRTVTTATVTQQGQVRGRSPIATVSSNQGKRVRALLITQTSKHWYQSAW